MISLVNPIRPVDAMPDFTMSKNRLGERWAVNLALDLNVIAKMERCFFEGNTLESEGLVDLVNSLQDGSVVIVPGFALFEVSSEFSARARDGYECFVSKYLPGYVDTPGTTHSPYRDVTQTRRYDDASQAKRVTFSRTYMAMLLLFIVAKQNSLEPEQKFSTFINRMAELTGGIGVLEARTAQFVFFDRSRVQVGPWSNFCRSIRSNFLKSGGTSEKVRLNSFNQAHDLSLIKNATSIHGQTENGFRTDYWVAADDEGLINLCRTFRYNIESDGFYNGEFIHINNLFPELELPGFWEETTKELQRYHYERERERNFGFIDDLTFDQLEANVKTLHNKVDSLPYP